MIRKLSLAVMLMVAACFAGLAVEGSLVPTANAMTIGQNDNRDMDRHDTRMNRRRHRRHRRWARRHRHYERRNRNANDR